MNNKTGYPSIDKTHLEGTKFFERNPIIPNMSVYNTLKLISSKFKNEKAIDCLDLKVTYDELIKNSALLAKSLKELGVKKDDIITISMPNFYQAVVMYFACNSIGATTTFLNSAAEEQEIKHYLNLFESPLLFNFDKSREYNESILKDTKVRQTITLDQASLNNITFNKTSDGIYGYNDCISFNDFGLLSSFYKRPYNTLFGGNQSSLILFTSGTTGNPKSVVLTNKNILAAEIYAKNTSHTENITGSKTLICVPFCYPYGFVTSALTSLLWGKESILAPSINKNNIKYYYSKKPSIVFGSPALLDLTIQNISNEQDLSSVTHFISGGDFLTVSHAKRGEKFFEEHGAKNVEIGNGFGNAETVSIGSTPVGVPLRQETAGKILVGSKAIIIDPDTFEEKKYGEEGILGISGDHVFKGYYKNNELTKQTKFIKNGIEYYNTGTRGIIDEQGYFIITGRQSRFYIMASLNKVYCDNVQNIISYFDCVKDCAVVKVPDEQNLYVSKAYIVLNEGYSNSEEVMNYIKALCSKPCISSLGQTVQLKSYEIPTYIEFVDKLPRKSGSDKIDYEYLEVLAQQKTLNQKTLKLKKGI